MKFSIIIPTLNEEDGIQRCLSALQPLRSTAEIIVADGGSDDNTVERAAALADKIVCSATGRARQMNAGADQATGDVLLFLHADTSLPPNALHLIRQQLGSPGQWGHFDIHLSGKPVMLKVIAFMMNRRSRLTGIATGDQAIFVSHTVFSAIGQYPDIALMEDIALCKTLNKLSRPICLDAKVSSSGRRWERHGVWQTIVLMWRLRWRYFLGADPDALAALYNKGK
ncbi:MAG: TIGR04283 family arsenosugar biosynthesis glycosyltransferase [Methylovulum sp.]|nr:TIGR04283 family arsenosugar biosynthesis glycosyltransferase [Methylovulum sp.]